MKEPAMNPDPEQQRRDDEASRRQSGLEPRPDDGGREEEGARKRDGPEDGDEAVTAG